MQWTKQRPSERGYYWVRNFRWDADSAVIGQPTIVFLYNGLFRHQSVPAEFPITEGEFFGPLEAPE